MTGSIRYGCGAVNRCLKLGLILFAIACASVGASPSISAEIQHDEIGEDLSLIFLTGELELGDEEIFIDRAVDMERAIVVFHSPGGNLFAGLRIGEAIRLKGFMTWVPDGYECASACALAWLGGRVRYLSPEGRIGFHAAFEISDAGPRERGLPNAQVGAYLNRLDLTSRAIYCVTSAPPESMTWLTIEDAQECGIDVERWGDPQERIPAPPRLPDSNQHLSERAIYYFQGNEGEAGRATEGSVEWSRTISENSPAIQAIVRLEQRGVTTTVTIRHNEDPTLPASHLVEVKFSGNLDGHTIQRVPALVLKQAEQARGQPLAGAAVSLTDSTFWIALSDDTDQALQNMKLLAEGLWFDLPILFRDGTRALLTFEKGARGERVFKEVLGEWAEAPERQRASPTASICADGYTVASGERSGRYHGARRQIENGVILEFSGVDFPGSDYDSLPGIPLINCITLCRFNASCRAYTYNKSAKHCFLKNDWTQAQAHVDAYSGLKCLAN
jgi:hypothetical protein